MDTQWYRYKTVEGRWRAVRKSDVACIREDTWVTAGGGREHYTKLVSASGTILARVPLLYADVIDDFGIGANHHHK